MAHSTVQTAVGPEVSCMDSCMHMRVCVCVREMMCVCSVGARDDGALEREVSSRPLDRTIDLRISTGELGSSPI